MRTATRTKPKNQIHTDRAHVDRQPADSRSFVRRWAVLAACLLFAATATWVVLEFVVWNKIPALLVGKWVVEGGEQDGATFDFFRNGSMVGHINLQGRIGIVKAQVRVEGETLFSTTRSPHRGTDDTREQKIVRLTKSELVLQDERGQVLRMFRADD
jgi:hypothetical protein